MNIDGLVIECRKVKTYDKRITVLTKGLGKVYIFIKDGFSLATNEYKDVQLLSKGTFDVKSTESGLYILDKASYDNRLIELYLYPDYMFMLIYLCEFLNEFIQEESDEREVQDLFLSLLGILGKTMATEIATNKTNTIKVKQLVSIFEIKTLYSMGFLPYDSELNKLCGDKMDSVINDTLETLIKEEDIFTYHKKTTMFIDTLIKNVLGKELKSKMFIL